MLKPFDFPEIDKLFNELFPKLFNESGRGAILICAAHIEDFLTELIKTSLPSEASKQVKDKLFNYPGHLSTFSSKIELAYAFRLINSNLYNRLLAFKKIRNDAAHISSNFTLMDLSNKLASVYDLGPSFSQFIRKISADMMMKIKLDAITAHLTDIEISPEDQRTIVTDLLKRKEVLKSIEEQVPHWELLNGICLICGYIVYEQKRIQKATEKISTWGEVVGSNGL